MRGWWPVLWLLCSVFVFVSVCCGTNMLGVPVEGAILPLVVSGGRCWGCCIGGTAPPGGAAAAAPLAVAALRSLRRLRYRQKDSRPIIPRAAAPPTEMPTMAPVDRPLEFDCTGYDMAQTTLTTAEVGFDVSVGSPARPAVRVGTVAMLRRDE